MLLADGVQGLRRIHHAKFRQNWSVHCGDTCNCDFFNFWRWRLPPLWIYLGHSLATPGEYLVSLYHCAKFSSSSFDNMNISIFGTFGWKTLIHAPKLGFWGYLTSKWGAISTEPKKAHPCVSPCHLSHQEWKSGIWPLGEFLIGEFLNLY